LRTPPHPTAGPSVRARCRQSSHAEQGQIKFTAADLLFIVAFAGAGALGFVQGALRQVLGLAVLLVAFVLGAGLRQPLGNWSASYWTDVPVQFSWMFAMLISFLAFLALGMVLVGTFYKGSRVLARIAHADEAAGMVLGVALAATTLSVVVFILDSFYRYRGIPITGGDVGWLRSLHQAIDGSATVGVLRESLIPLLTAALGPLLPEAVRRLVP
jgi:uncharacterized membrane protein required for colicin V production